MQRIWRIARWLRCIGVLFFVLLCSAPLWWWLAIWYILTPPDFSHFLSYRPVAVTEVFSRGPDQLPIHMFYGVEDYIEKIPVFRRIVDYEHIKTELRFAILAIEDHRFFDHNGVDAVAFWGRSFATNVVASTRFSMRQKTIVPQFKEGASTVTQQACRLIYFSGDLAAEQRQKRTNLQKLYRKFKEQSCAVHLERFLTEELGSSQQAKEAIFTMFANVAPMGNGRYGFAAAAEYYFGKKLHNIAVDEAATLAGIPKNPERYNPHHPEAARDRRNVVLSLMKRNGYVSEGDLEEFRKKSVTASAPQSKEQFAPAVGNLVRREISERWGTTNLLFRGVISVHTTINHSAQRILNAVMDEGRHQYLDRHQDHVSPDDAQRFQGAAVVLSNKGEILAVYGGYRATDTSLNRAIPHSALIRRQPGSAFKPFVYLAALEMGWSLDDRINDVPISINMGRGRSRKKIHNYDNRSKGWIPMRQALAESRNLATVWLAGRLGAKEIVEWAIRLGLPRPVEAYPTTAIGAEEVTPLEMARAFAVFANGGDLATPYLISHVVTYQGNILIAKEPEHTAVISGMSAEFMVELLRGAVLLPHATAQSAKNCPIEFFGKTGTTNNFRDAWFVGSTYGSDGITVALWFGFDNNKSLSRDARQCDTYNPKKKHLYCEPGGRIALPVFRSFIEQYYQDTQAPRIPSLVEESVRRVAGIR